MLLKGYKLASTPLTVVFLWGTGGVLRDPVVKCLTRCPRVLGSTRTVGSSVCVCFFFVGLSLGKTLQSPSLVLVKHRKDLNNVSCHRDVAEILSIWLVGWIEVKRHFNSRGHIIAVGNTHVLSSFLTPVVTDDHSFKHGCFPI